MTFHFQDTVTLMVVVMVTHTVVATVIPMDMTPVQYSTGLVMATLTAVTMATCTVITTTATVPALPWMAPTSSPALTVETLRSCKVGS